MANVTIHKDQGGDAMTVGDGGSITLEDGASMPLGASVTLSVSGTNVLITGLPTSDPSVAGALYTNTGVLTVSAG